MDYKVNVHVLLPANEFEELRNLSFRKKNPRSKLIREAISAYLRKHSIQERQSSLTQSVEVKGHTTIH